MSAELTGDPLLVAPGSGATGLDSVGGYRLQPGSPCRDSDMPIDQHGGRDYWGNPLDAGRPDRGANELPANPAPRPATTNRDR